MEWAKDLFSRLISRIDDPLVFAGAFMVFLFLLWWWGLRKVFSFSIVIALLFFFMIKLDKLAVDYFGSGDGSFLAILPKPIFIFFMIMVFLYYVFIKE